MTATNPGNAFKAGNVVVEQYSFLNIAGATTSTVKTGAGIFRRVVVNKGVAAATITVYDNTSAASPIIATITLDATTPRELNFDAAFSTGLTVVTSGATDITVIFR